MEKNICLLVLPEMVLCKPARSSFSLLCVTIASLPCIALTMPPQVWTFLGEQCPVYAYFCARPLAAPRADGAAMGSPGRWLDERPQLPRQHFFPLGDEASGLGKAGVAGDARYRTCRGSVLAVCGAGSSERRMLCPLCESVIGFTFGGPGPRLAVLS